jgi:hypothetical protein
MARIASFFSPRYFWPSAPSARNRTVFGRKCRLEADHEIVVEATAWSRMFSGKLFEAVTLIQAGKIKNFPVVIIGTDYRDSPF